MLWLPTASGVVVVNVATPLAFSAAALFSTVDPSRKFTEPVGAVPALPVTVAVKVLFVPKTMLFEDTPSAVALKMPAPVPLSAIVCVPVTSLSVSVSVPVMGPVTVGLKVTVMTHGVPTTICVPQGLATTLKLALATMLETVIGDVPPLVTVTVCVLDVFSTCDANVRLGGLKESTVVPGTFR